MHSTIKPDNLPDELHQMDLLKEVELDVLIWLVSVCEYNFLDAGEFLIKKDEEVEAMHILVRGELAFYMGSENDLREASRAEPGQIVGRIPFSRMKASKGYLRAIKPSYLLSLDRKYFPEIAQRSQVLLQELVGLLISRVRDFTQYTEQNEKFVALGKLSAGLAHELNNPASAIVRCAVELRNKVHQTPDKFKAITSLRLTEAQIDAVNAILFGKLADKTKKTLPALQRMQKEDEILDWMAQRGVERPEEPASTFVDMGIDLNDLIKIEQISGRENLSQVIWWMESTLSIENLVEVIQQASERIAKLVLSVKTYTHMDRGGDKSPVNLHEGIRNTLVMLGHKLKAKRIRLVEDFDLELPDLWLYVSEINQVWTNLIDNAIDAMKDQGTLTLHTRREAGFAIVEIQDDGEGIPADNISKIFDPFFTTKPIGHGTGMGLDIVKRIVDKHQGRIWVTSVPGKTIFNLAIPIESK